MIRRGVSLMEVMFAIGVAMIGLLGVTAVLPVALHQIGRGTLADRSSRAGQNSLAQFESRGLNDATLWLPASTPAAPTSPVSSVTLAAGTAYAIDPLFVSRNGSQSSTGLNSALFPYATVSTAPTVTGMTRVTLRSSADSGDGTLYNFPLRGAQAEQLFMSRDELVIDLPDVKDAFPEQQFTAERSFAGTISWLATLTPTLGGTSTETYTLSVVVFQNRDLRFYDDLNANGVLDSGEPGLNNERVVSITFPGTGLGGGEVTLISSSIEALTVRRGDWLMLMGPRSGSDVYGWYEVIDAERDPRPVPSSTNWQLDATLAGPDWSDDSTNANDTKAALFNNIIVVYQKVTRLTDIGL